MIKLNWPLECDASPKLTLLDFLRLVIVFDYDDSIGMT